MKNKIVLLMIGVAVITLSFTFSSTKNTKSVGSTSIQRVQNEPIGGFALEDKK